MSNSILEIANAAFDEGSRSPYELKPFIVQELIASVKPQESLQLDLPLTAQHLMHTLPRIVRQFVNVANVWLCGGAIVKLLVDPTNSNLQWKSSDYDLYCNDQTFHAISQTHRFTQDAIYGNFQSARCIISGTNINIIYSDKFVNSASILSHFDFTMVQFAYQETACFPSLFASENTQSDLLKNEIKISDTYSTKKVTSSLRARIKKYIKRGFRDCTGIVEQNVLHKLVRKN